MHFSLLLQMALSGSSGRLEAFRHATLPDECTAWRELAAFGRERVTKIAGSDDKREFQHFLSALDDLGDYWSAGVPTPASDLHLDKPKSKSKPMTKRSKSATAPKRWMK